MRLILAELAQMSILTHSQHAYKFLSSSTALFVRIRLLTLFAVAKFVNKRKRPALRRGVWEKTGQVRMEFE